MKLLLAVIAIIANQKLIMLINAHRHGIRYSDAQLPVLPHWFSDDLYSELSPSGMRQEYLLGKYIRLKYGDFLPSTYNASQIYVRSTDLNRTILSAQSQLNGAFNTPFFINESQIKTSRPPAAGDFEGIENALGTNVTLGAYFPACIEVEALQYDNLLAPDWGGCNYYNMITYEYASTQEFINLTNVFMDKYLPIIASYFNFDRSQFNSSDIISLLDEIIAAKFNNAIEVEKDLMNIVTQQYAQFFSLEVIGNSSFSKQLIKLCSSIFLRNVVELFENKVKNATQLKYAEFSFHDSNIMYILFQLGYFTQVTYVPFASNIQFELLEENGKYHVNIIYNGNSIINTDFHSFHEMVFNSTYSKEQWIKECSKTAS